jgi:hypothetical protein
LFDRFFEGETFEKTYQREAIVFCALTLNAKMALASRTWKNKSVLYIDLI